MTPWVKDWNWDELAVLEAACRALRKSGRGKRFDPAVFDAIAKAELAKLREELAKRPMAT